MLEMKTFDIFIKRFKVKNGTPPLKPHIPIFMVMSNQKEFSWGIKNLYGGH